MFDYIYDYFQTRKNISKKDLENIPNIFNYIEPIKTQKSILDTKEFKLELEEYIKKYNIKKKDADNFKKIIILELFNNVFHKHIIDELSIDEFIQEFIHNKENINNAQKSIDNYFKLEKVFTYNILNNSQKKMIYENPIIYGFNEIILKDDIVLENNLNSKLYNKYEDIKISLDILLIGNIINLSLPSIGLVDTIFSKSNTVPPKTIISMIDKILNEDKLEDNILNEIPLFSLNVGNIISSILLINNNKKTNLEIPNMINNIQINVHNIFFKKETNKKKDKIKTEYVIPYKYDAKNQIISMTKMEIEKINDINGLMKHNKELFLHTLIDIFKSSDGKKKLNEKNYKNVLACFLFFLIRIIYDIIKEYINNIDILLTQLLNVKNKKFDVLNIEGAFEYTTLLNTSLYKFKLVLLNNFYHLFLPSKIIKNNYGMEKDANNCYVPESNSIFMNSNEYIYNHFPIECNNKFIIEKIQSFILNIKENNDIYNKNDILEFGGYSFDTEIMKISMKKINEYYSLLQKNNNFTLFIIDKIIDNFKNENIPYEFISDLESEKDEMMSSSFLSIENKEKLKKILVHKFTNDIEVSTSYYIKLLDIRKKIKEVKEIKNANINTLYNIELIYTLCFKLYRMRSVCLMIITEKLIDNIDLKNKLLSEYDKIKKSCEKNISKYI